MNVAQTLLEKLGVPMARDPKQANGSKNASSTKSGPGRYRTSGKPGNRIAKARAVRAYKALMAAWAAKRITKAKLRDESGAYTLAGRKTAFNGETIRRMWLAGISAQRGF